MNKIQSERAKDHELVKGIFRCHEPAGGNVSFFFKKYRGDKTEHYYLEDGKSYELPLMVAKHLNKNCVYKTHKFLMDSNGDPLPAEGDPIKRFSFESLAFYEDQPHDHAA